MKKYLPVLLIALAMFAWAGIRPMLGAQSADPISNATAVVTVKDFDFFATGNNPVGVAVDPSGDLKVGILGLPIPGPRPSTPIASHMVICTLST